MERLKLNIQLFGGSLAITAYETDVDINNNTSYIYVELKPSTNSTTYNENNSAYVQATLTGQNDTFTIPKTYFNIGKGKTVTAYSGKIGPFRHNADGSLNNVSISANCYIVSNTQPTATASVAMSTIPRASSISSITGDQIGSNVTVTISRASSSFTHKIQVIYGEKRTDWISFGSNTSATFTIPMDFCNSTYLQNTDNGQFIFWLSTESNGTSIGTTQTLKTMYVPSSVKPTISSVTKSDTANLANTYGGYVQGKSGLRIQTSASGAYGSSITGCVVTIKNSGGTVLRTLNGTDVTISNISYTGTLTIVSTVTDSRNRSVSNTSTVSVLAYSAPVVDYFTANRVSGSEGTVKLTWKSSITSLNSHNGKNFYVYYRQTGTSSWTQLTSKTDAYSWQNDNYTTAKDAAYSWDFKFECWDNFTASGHIIKTANVIGAFKLVNYRANGTGIAFGKYSENDNTIELGLKTMIPKDSAKGIYNSDNKPILHDYGNQNVVLNASGDGLYLGFQNTTRLNILNGKLNIDSSGNINYPNNNGVGIYWKEGNYGDQFKICPSFSGTGDTNELQFKGAVGDSGTSPSLVTLMTLKGENGHLWTKGYVDALYCLCRNGIYSKVTGQVATPVGNSNLIIKRATSSEAPNNGVVLEFGNSTNYTGQLYIGDNASQGIYYNGWSNGTRGSWKRLAPQDAAIGVQLYYNATGVGTGSVALGETAANFDYIEVFYKPNGDVLYSNKCGNRSEKIYLPNGKKFQMAFDYDNGTYWYHCFAQWEISGTSITKKSETRWRVAASTAAQTRTDTTSSDSNIYIYRVVGYRTPYIV